MKKILLPLTLILVLTLTACAASTATVGPGEAATSASTSLSAEETLLVGSFSLEGTGQVITADQAADLLPLWQVYAELLTSDTAAQVEIDALLVQIEETMTAGQISAIEAMSLTQQDVFTVMQEQNIGMALSSSAGSDTTASQSSGGMVPSDGGGAPPDGGIPMGDMGEAASVSASSSEASAGSTASGPISMLIEALIQLLQSKLAG